MMSSTIEKILFLKSVTLFERISDDDFVWISEMTRYVHFDEGEQFITQGDFGDCLYIAVSGEIDIMVDGTGKVATLRERDVIGEMSILSGSPRAASCVAATAVTALKIVREPFLDLLRERPELALGVIQTLVKRLDTSSRQAKFQAS
ncbi:MAG: cyclic nucleotide-binding domain-containing protein [Planctomycetota bacterium]|jgi:CRP-like cAMP-binding protein